MRRSIKVLASLTAFSAAGYYYLRPPTMSLDVKKDHHQSTGFRNPWPSFIDRGIFSVLKMATQVRLNSVTKNATADDYPATVKINHDALRNPSNDHITVTWLGHACALVQLNGYNVLFDPIFSNRCSPVQFAGPARYTQPPASLDELPRIDAVVISHNHYDHLDLSTIESLAKKHPDTRFLVPLGNKAWFGALAKETTSDGAPRVEELDWWDERTVVLGNDASVRFTCTPCQHFSGRTPFDRNRTLWASWCVEGLVGDQAKGKVFFGGDTGYRTVPPEAGPEREYDEAYLSTLPHCPAFKEIGDRFGSFDVALIPIGAYSPRWFMSAFHCDTNDAVRVHEDIKSKRSIGIHWGTFALTDEPMSEPPRRLKACMEGRGHSPDDFGVLKLGETTTVPV
ncbi:beta-lactamase superfamily domain-containing protein [Gongronella butleri]|nr:beta-lactamase superfamily domain-containing protein [Gongronella butleri]